MEINLHATKSVIQVRLSPQVFGASSLPPNSRWGAVYRRRRGEE